jgi:hypothetical protein
MGAKFRFRLIDSRRQATLRAARSLIALLCFVAAAVLVRRATAQGDGGVRLSARAGYDGYTKSDFWVPVYVRSANDGPAVQGYLQVMTGSSASNDRVVYRSPISLPTTSDKGQTLYVHLSSLSSELTVELLDENDRVVESAGTGRLTALAGDALLYGVVTRAPGRLDYLEDVTGGRSEAAVAYLDLAELPETAAALNALDVLLFHEVDTGRLTPGQLEALKGWLDVGGQLVVAGGADWQETTAGLAELLPVKIKGTQTLDDIPALRAFSDVSFRDPGPYQVTESDLRSGETLLHQDDTPLLARQQRGRGSIFFLALDPGLAPLLDWDGSEAVWSEIVRFARPLPDWAYGARQSYAATSAVSSLPASDLPPAWALFIFLMTYVAVIGPVNYFVLRRLGRRELAWLTIPVLVIFFSVTAYVMGFRIKGNETIINQMSIVYGHSEGDLARVQTLIGLYSPRRTSYDLMLPGDALPRPFQRSYGALSGGGSGAVVEQGETTLVADIRVDVGGVETLVADSYRPAPDLSGQVRLRPSAGALSLEIEVLNNSSQSFENLVLLAGPKAISLGDLGPGSRVSHSEQVASLASGPAAASPIGAFVPFSTSPLLANMDTILGSSNYYNDRKVYPRWQFVQSMAPDYSTGGGSEAANAFTLIAWSNQPQLDLKLSEEPSGSMATSLYLLELPVRQELSGDAPFVVPPELLNWRVIDQVGVYDPRISDLYLSEGRIEFEFTPWPDFGSITVRNLSIVVQPPSGYPSQRLPGLHLWDWEAQSWHSVASPDWGHIKVEDPRPYVGPGSAIRLRLSNPGPEAINIDYVYPELTGAME